MQSGKILGQRYQLQVLMGEGGMGEVWCAVDLRLNAPVAVKLLRADSVGNPDSLVRFHREAQAAANLRSPHVVQILDHGIDVETNLPFIAMELLSGESLAKRLLRVGRLSPAETARIITEVARALARAHEAGIVHRDLKPDNVFLVSNGEEEIAKVLDFGIAKTRADAIGAAPVTQSGAVMGTPCYMSPEQITGSKSLDHRTDLWAVAVMTCECLTGKRPFVADSVGALAVMICTERPPRASQLGPVPPGFDAWFERATQREPGARFQTAQELTQELRKVCLGPLPVSDPSWDSRPLSQGTVEPAVVTSVRSLVRTVDIGKATATFRRPVVWLIAALALAIVVVLLAIFPTRSERGGSSASAQLSEQGRGPALEHPAAAPGPALSVESVSPGRSAEEPPVVYPGPVAAPPPPASASPASTVAPRKTAPKKSSPARRTRRVQPA